VLALDGERFAHLHLRRPHVAHAIVDERPVHGLARRDVDAAVVHAELLARLDVIVDEHTPAAADEHLADLDRREPVDVQVCDEARRIVQGQVGDIHQPARCVRRAGGRHGARALGDEIVDDGEVVRREIPEHVGVALEEPEIDAHRVEVVQLAELAAVDDRLHPAHGPV
jgi:hypothetical protein